MPRSRDIIRSRARCARLKSSRSAQYAPSTTVAERATKSSTNTAWSAQGWNVDARSTIADLVAELRNKHPSLFEVASAQAASAEDAEP